MLPQKSLCFALCMTTKHKKREQLMETKTSSKYEDVCISDMTQILFKVTLSMQHTTQKREELSEA